MKLRPAHLAFFVFLLAALGAAHAAPSPARETMLRTRGDFHRLSSAPFRSESKLVFGPALGLPHTPICSPSAPAILGTGNHPAKHAIALQAFTSSLR